MDKNKINIEIGEYEINKNNYQTLSRLVAGYLEHMVENLFKEGEKILFSVQNREKSINSLKKKLKEDDKVDSYNQIEDLAGTRLIFYFLDNLEEFVNHLTAILSNAFGAYSAENIHYKIDLSSAEFGYNSCHFPVLVSPNTIFFNALNPEDQKNLKNLYCEVQIRTFFQHGWAEPEHDLRYKLPSGTHFPDEIKRVDRREWLRMAVMVEDLDNKLVERKKFLKVISSAIEEPKLTWKYHKFDYNGAYKLGTIYYGYDLLHDYQGRLINLKVSWQIFNINDRMKNEGVKKNYKNTIWEGIKKTNPEFISQLDTYDTTIVRVIDWNQKTRTLSVQPAHYTDALVSNHKLAAEKNIPNLNLKVKDIAYENKRFKSFRKSPLTNSIGVSCVIRTSDDRWIIGKRTKRLAFDPGYWACPASGALEWGVREFWGDFNFDNWFKGAISSECNAELGIPLKAKDFIYLGFAREIQRLGKPQFFFFLDLLEKKNPINAEDLKIKWRIYAKDYEVSILKALTIDEIEKLINADEKLIKEINLSGNISEELRMNLALALKYLKDSEDRV